MAKLPIDFAVARPHAADLLDQLGSEYLGGPSVRGWSKISSYMICKRMYFLESIRKLRSKKSSPALDIGTLCHACMAAHYYTGGQKTWEPLAVVEETQPELAAEVRRLLNAYFSRYADSEAATWDVRAVEFEVIGSISHNGATAPVSCRFDLLIRKKTEDQPSLAWGPSPEGVWIVDHKFLARLTRDIVEGYSMDGQFLLMAYLWRQQGLTNFFGPLNGFIINIVTKTQKPECKRLDIAIDDQDVERFANTIAPVTTEIDFRVQTYGPNEEAWPMNFAVCKSPRGYGICKYHDLCASHGKNTDMYEVAPWKQPSAK